MFEKMNIFSKSSLKILHFLGRRYMEGYHMREIVRRLGIGLGSASDALKMLEKEELVIKEEKGGLSIYRANMENPLLKELKVIFTLLELDETIKDLKEISRKVILFGSCAEGEDNEKSDIDVFILAENKKLVSTVIDTQQKKISRKISAIIVDSVEFKTLREKDRPLYERIESGRVLFEVSV